MHSNYWSYISHYVRTMYVEPELSMTVTKHQYFSFNRSIPITYIVASPCTPANWAFTTIVRRGADTWRAHAIVARTKSCQTAACFWNISYDCRMFLKSCRKLGGAYDSTHFQSLCSTIPSCKSDRPDIDHAHCIELRIIVQMDRYLESAQYRKLWLNWES